MSKLHKNVTMSFKACRHFGKCGIGVWAACAFITATYLYIADISWIKLQMKLNEVNNKVKMYYDSPEGIVIKTK